MFKKLCWLVVLCLCFMHALQAGTPQTVAQEVLDRLYATNGNYQFAKPKIALSPDNQRVAAYSPWKNTITLDEKVFSICRSFGRDSVSALAYIIGHELVHAYQVAIRENRVTTNFLAYTRNYSNDVRIEKSADIQGVFNAQLAGFRALEVMPKVIERIYQEYRLIGKDLKGYPGLAERQGSVQEVTGIVQNLLDVFESSNYLLVIGEYDLAASGFQYILQHYQGYEIYNNLGVAFALAAQTNYWNPATDKFVYPLEVDWYSKLSQVLSRGAEQLDPGLEPMRLFFLEKAEQHFRSAVRLRPDYLPAHTNLVCVLNMMGKPDAALLYADQNLNKYLSGRNRKKQNAQDVELAELAMGITYALLPGNVRKAEASAVFQRLKGSEHVVPALYAQQNSQSLYGPPEPNVLTSVSLPDQFRQTIIQIRPEPFQVDAPLVLDAESGIAFGCRHKASQTTSIFLEQPGINRVTLQRFGNRTRTAANVLLQGEDLERSAYRNILPARGGFYLHAEADKAVLKVDKSGNVLEMVRYVRH